MSEAIEYKKSLYPESITLDRYCKALDDIKCKLQNLSDEDKILELMDSYADIPYYFNNKKDNFMPSIKDVAVLYVLMDYISNNEFNRKSCYSKFVKNENDKIKELLYDMLKDKNKNVTFSNVKLDIVKGSIYKIKKYFLENNKIKDIRGASAIIDYINIDVTFQYLRKNYIEECALYCGGGNVLLVLPEGEGKKVCCELEKKYSEISLTAKNAFEYESVTLGEFAFNYKDCIKKINDKLTERSKLKIFPINPDYKIHKLEGLMTSDTTCVSFNYISSKQSTVCELCGLRDAKYSTKSEGENIDVCPSCLRKNTVGSSKARFFEEYKKSVNCKMNKENEINSVNDIGDSRGYVAVIYADGNNMGKVIKDIKNPYEQMYFSRKLDKITKKCIYESIYEVMGEEARFEAIALGGDDIFLIVPADKSLEVTQKIIDKFDSAFNYNMTMSAGISIARSKTPIQNMFTISQHSLKNAKKHVKQHELNKGTVDLVVMEGSNSINLETKKEGLFPMTGEKLRHVLNKVEHMKNDKDINKSQIYKLDYAANTMNEIEFKLFYLYQQARTSHKYTEYITEIFDLKDNDYFDGLINLGNKKEKIIISPWNDIKVLWNFTGGEEFAES